MALERIVACMQIYRLSSLDYCRVLSHVRRDAIAEARELQQQAAAEAAARAAQATAVSTDRFGNSLWEGRAAVSDSETPSSCSGTSFSTITGRWRQRSWRDRAKATAASGRPLAFLGERWLDGRKDFESQRRLISGRSASIQSLPNAYSEALSISDSFLSSSQSDAGMQSAVAAAVAARLRQSRLDFAAGIDGSADYSDEDTFIEDSLRLSGSFGSVDGLASDIDHEPVEAHGFLSPCKGVKASVSTIRLSHSVKKRKSSVISDVLNLSFEAAGIAVLAQPPEAEAATSSTTDCTVLSIMGVDVRFCTHYLLATPDRMC